MPAYSSCFFFCVFCRRRCIPFCFCSSFWTAGPSRGAAVQREKKEKKKKTNLCHRSLKRGAPPRNPANAGQGGQNTNISTRTQMREREVKNKGNSELNEHALVTQKCFHQTPFQTRLRAPPPPHHLRCGITAPANLTEWRESLYLDSNGSHLK